MTLWIDCSLAKLRSTAPPDAPNNRLIVRVGITSSACGAAYDNNDVLHVATIITFRQKTAQPTLFRECRSLGTEPRRPSREKNWTYHTEKRKLTCLAVGVHFYLYATLVPEEGNVPDPCLSLMLHADSSGPYGKVKEVFLTEETELTGSLSLGTFRFQEIANAFDAIDANAPGEAEYNIVTNNCAVLILGMMKSLDIQLSPSDRAQIASGLVAADEAADHKLANYVRESGEIERSLGLTHDSTNGQLVERLTLRQIVLALDAEDIPIDDPSTDLLTAASKPSMRSGHAAQRNSSPGGEGSGSDAEGDKHRELIVGGKGVTTQEFPLFVQSEERTGQTAYLHDQPLCGAVLVAPDVILTTAGECYGTFALSTSRRRR